MNKQLGIFLAGLLVVVPFAISVYLIWAVGAWVNKLGTSALSLCGIDHPISQWIGALVVIVGVYLIGLLTHFWMFRKIVELFERLFRHVPGVKTLYESVRDLMKLFGSKSKRMGQVVLYRQQDGGSAKLGILTSDSPPGIKPQENKVAVYFPFSYMIGGEILYVSADRLEHVDMPVETALKLCATAYVGASAGTEPESDKTDTAKNKTG